MAKNGYFIELSMLDCYFKVLAKNPRGSISDTEVVSMGFGRVF